MCGIAGIVNLTPDKKNNPALISSMTQAIKHRGPDGEGFLFASSDKFICGYSDDTPSSLRNLSFSYSPTVPVQDVNESWQVQLGHRRLSIIDLSAAGHQPMCTQDKRYWITFNGEIYNYIELREQLKQHGFAFTTQTDTEVILKAYEHWGFECENRFNGMWAFVIYDRKKNTLFGSRDRFGVKPLYYYKDKNNFAFASEQKALLQLPFVKKEINKTAAFDFFALNTLEKEEEGLFKNIYELKPAHSFTLNINTGEFSNRKYYRLNWNSEYENYNPRKSTEYIFAIQTLVKNAIELRLRSDAVVGTCLSGGIDSSTIACVINDLMKIHNYNQVGSLQNAFTSSFTESRFDESAWAKAVVDSTKTSWHQVFPQRDDFMHDAEKLAYGHDLPIWSISSYAQYKVMQLAKENNVKVLLDGQGADELFGGYKQYELSLLQEYKRKGELKKYWQERTGFNQTNRQSFLPRLTFKRWVESSAPFPVKNFFFGDLQFINPDLLNDYRQRWQLAEQSSYSLNDNLQKDFDGTFLKELLRREDRNGMINSVEARTPFADDINLIEYVFNIPGTYKIRGGTSKYLLREAFKGILPQEVYARKDKMGFVTPNNRWMSELREQFRQYFTSDLQDYVNLPLLLKHFDSFFNNPDKPENYRTFKFISFAIWQKVFEVK